MGAYAWGKCQGRGCGCWVVVVGGLTGDVVAAVAFVDSLAAIGAGFGGLLDLRPRGRVGLVVVAVQLVVLLARGARVPRDLVVDAVCFPAGGAVKPGRLGLLDLAREASRGEAVLEVRVLGQSYPQQEVVVAGEGLLGEVLFGVFPFQRL